MLDNLEIEIKKWDKDYSFSSEEDDKKRVYTIYSPKLKQKLREVISPYAALSKVSIQYEGKNSYGDSILYQQGKGDLPDRLTLTSREVVERLELTDGVADEKKKEKDVWEGWDEKWKGLKNLWEKQEAESGTSSSSATRHYFSGRNKDGEIVYEASLVKSETQTHFISLENKKPNPPLLQDSKEVIFTPRQQVPPKK